VYELKDGLVICVEGGCGNAQNIPLSDRQWHSVVIAVEAWTAGGTVNLYVDGSLKTTFQTVNARMVVTAKKHMWVLGRRHDSSSSRNFKGQLDEFCLFEHAFGQSDVDLYHSSGGAPFLKRKVYQPLERTYYLPPYTHPRVYMTPAGLEEWRERVRDNEVASRAREHMQKHLDATLLGPSSAVGQMYRRFLACADHDFGPYTYDQLDVEEELFHAVLLALVDEDVDRQAELAAALACFAEVLYRSHSPAEWMLDHNHNHYVAMSYDFLYPAMSEPQRSSVRRFVAKMTKYRQSYGSLMAVHEASTNWAAFHDDVALSALAIEGETGYDPTVWELHVKKQRKFLKNGCIFESGFTHGRWGRRGAPRDGEGGGGRMKTGTDGGREDEVRTPGKALPSKTLMCSKGA